MNFENKTNCKSDLWLEENTISKICKILHTKAVKNIMPFSLNNTSPSQQKQHKHDKVAAPCPRGEFMANIPLHYADCNNRTTSAFTYRPPAF